MFYREQSSACMERVTQQLLTRFMPLKRGRESELSEQGKERKSGCALGTLGGYLETGRPVVAAGMGFAGWMSSTGPGTEVVDGSGAFASAASPAKKAHRKGTW